MPSTSTLHAPQLARLQLRLVPVRPNFMAITSHKRRARFIFGGVRLAVDDERRFLPGHRRRKRQRSCGRRKTVSPPTTVRATPEPAAFRKFLRE